MKTKQEYLDYQAETIAQATRLYNKAVSLAPRVFITGTYEAYLRFMARWNHFSMPNSLLLFLQKPDARFVCGFRKWQQLAQAQGYPSEHMILSKEERKKGIALLLPFSFNKNSMADRYLTYKEILVFDVSQVNQIKAPRQFQPAKAMQNLDAYAHLAIYRSAFEELHFVMGQPDDPNFQYQHAYSRKVSSAQEEHKIRNCIYVSPLYQNQTISASILQEIIRYMVGDTAPNLVPDSVTYAVCHYLHLPSPVPEFTNIETHQSSDPKELFDLLRQICHLTQQVLYRLECGWQKATDHLCDGEDVRQLLRQYSIHSQGGNNHVL